MKPARENLAGFIVYMKSRESFVISDGYIIPLRSHPHKKLARPPISPLSASIHPCGFIPAKTLLARALMPRQPYSAAVKSDR